jgi:NitT/TauT family transport system substrate-binding protein
MARAITVRARSVLRMAAAFCALAAIGTLPPSRARAETDTISFAQQQSIGYLQFDVIKHRHLLEQRAAELGLPALKVKWVTFNGPDMMNDALLSGAIDIVAGGVPGLLTIWNRTRGTAQEVRGVTALSQASSKLNTNNPAIHSIRDLLPTSRIVLPAVRVSVQAVVLEMAAAQAFGAANYGRLNAQTQSLAPSDATTGLLSGAGGFDCAFTPPPFPALQLRSPKIHTILDSSDVVGDVTASLLWTSKRFHDANPRLMSALVDSLKSASDFINQHRREALAYYIEDTHSVLTVDDLVAITTEPHASFGVTPHGIEKFAAFMAQIGSLKSAPASWKDVFFPEIADAPGN